MAGANIPEAEVDVDAGLAARLLADQHADLAGLPITQVANGWDNVIFRLGDDLALRIPRRELAAQLVVSEQEWLPKLASTLPLRIPAPVRNGRPTGYYPWHWSVVPWVPGEAVGTRPFSSPASAAKSLGEFLRALHQPTDGAAPENPWRGEPLAKRDKRTRENIAAVASELPASVERMAGIWNDAIAAPAWSGPPILLHGDLHPLNMIATNGELSAVIDFGDITDGDPATDLMVGFYLFDLADHGIFKAAAESAIRPIDDAMWLRAKGWALSHMTLVLAHSADSPELLAVARKGLQRVVDAS